MTICDDKENAPRHKSMSRSILKAQNEQVQFKPSSAMPKFLNMCLLEKPTD